MRRALNLFASPRGFAMVLGAVFAGFAVILLYFGSSVRQIAAEETLFLERQVRNGYVALLDLERLNLVLIAMLAEDEASEAARHRLQDALDFLYVRADTLQRRFEGMPQRETADTLAAALFALVERVEMTLASGGDDPRGLVHAVSGPADRAHAAAFAFMDDMRRLQEYMFEGQARTLRRQYALLLGLSAAMTVIGAGALTLLRREVVHRQQREIAEQRANYLAFFDPLTGLPNRVQFQDKVTQRLTRQRPSALVFLDLDNFKGINDTLGHAMGDAVLVAVAETLRREVEAQGGIPARLAGDEFAAWLPSDDTQALERFGTDLIAACATPVEHETDVVTPGVSVGIATTTQVLASQRADYDTMLRVADFALYVSKEGGRGRVTIYDSGLEQQYSDRRALLDALPEAIATEAIEIHLQPKVEIDSRRVYGFEALARWSPGGRVVPPDVFIRLAEEAGLVTDVDLLVLRLAASALADWNSAEGTALSVSANLSALHFNSGAIVDQVAAVLAESGLAPRLLTLEITETVQLKNWERVQDTLGRLRRLGCRIAVDDFGTGYSSLAYLRAMMADELKIDRSLVDEIETSDQARFVLDAVVDLAESLNMEVVVEGVQTESQARAVRALGCRRAQGYLFGRPVPVPTALVATRDARPLAASG